MLDNYLELRLFAGRFDGLRKNVKNKIIHTSPLHLCLLSNFSKQFNRQPYRKGFSFYQLKLLDKIQECLEFCHYAPQRRYRIF